MCCEIGPLLHNCCGIYVMVMLCYHEESLCVENVMTGADAKLLKGFHCYIYLVCKFERSFMCVNFNTYNLYS